MMKKTVLALTLAVLLGTGASYASAQSPDQNESGARAGGRGARRRFDPQQRVNMLAKRLKLTDDQKQKLLPVFTDEQQQMQNLWQDSSMSREDRMNKMRSLREESDSKIKGILTDEQKQKYDEMQAKMRGRMQDRMRDHRGDGSSEPQNQ